MNSGALGGPLGSKFISLELVYSKQGPFYQYVEFRPVLTICVLEFGVVLFWSTV